MKIARVFPRQTTGTPTDKLVYINRPPDMLVPEIDEVHISVTFTYDMKQAEYLYKAWTAVGVPIKIGGAAFGQPSGEFVPGLYLKKGYSITSRGCPNHCWFCSVPKREKGYRELTIKPGYIIQDDNLLAGSQQHICAVFDMLRRQRQRAVFSGGIEAKLLKEWHVQLLKDINTSRMYFAYDTPDDYEPLLQAKKLLDFYEFNRRQRCCYVLIGYPKDTIEKADQRIHATIEAGYFPFAMLYKDEQGHENNLWRRYQREWSNFSIIGYWIGKITRGEDPQYYQNYINKITQGLK